MSLINKMLQDLDARGGAREETLQQPALQAVPTAERRSRALRWAGGALLVALLAAGGWLGWTRWHAAPAPAPGPVPLVVPARPPAAPTAPTAPAATAVPVGLVGPAEHDPAASTAAVAAGSAAGGDGLAPAPAPAPAPAVVAATAGSGNGNGMRAAAAADGKRAGRGAATAGSGHGTSGSHGGRAHAAVGMTPTPPAASAAVLTPQQQADSSYRRALAALQDGRVSMALSELDHALELDPRNEAARQTYVALLLENRRTDDAIRQLRLALGLDPRQPALAMVLARLQLERGGPALETLLTTLPHAGASAEYQAMLAGVLQRANRHAEAVRYYEAALRLAPLNGVWWMGLGISLQAEQRTAEAREAYARARTGNGITPELLAFIERRLEQLAR